MESFFHTLTTWWPQSPFDELCIGAVERLVGTKRSDTRLKEEQARKRKRVIFDENKRQLQEIDMI
jgi:hypothetical protein